MEVDGPNDRPLHILIPEGLHKRLKAMAAARDRSVAAETRRAIEDRLKEFEPRSETPGEQTKAAA